MGFRVLLIAVTEKEPATIHQDYSVEPTDQFEDVPESPVTGAVLPSGAYLLYINDEIVPDDRVFQTLSKNANLISCSVNETVMNSFASSWADGVEQWSVVHDAQQGITHLETTGEPPVALHEIQARLLAEQETTDGADFLFDIPVELFVAQGGIRYDADIEGAGSEPWQILKRVKRRKKKWWPFG